MKTIRIILLSLMLGLFPSIAMSVTYEVTIDENGFSQSVIKIYKGDTVRWVNRGASSHSATSGSSGVANGLFDSGLLEPGRSFEHVFKFPELFAYFDRADTTRFGHIIVDGVTISPGDSVLVNDIDFNLMIIDKTVVSDAERPLTYSIFFDEVSIFKGTLNELTDFHYVARVYGLRSGATVLVSPMPPKTLPLGVHILRIEVASRAGRLLTTDQVTYTVLEAETGVPVLQ